MPDQSYCADEGPGFDCFNPKTSVESAVCGDAELTKLYRRNHETHERLKAHPDAFDIMLGSVQARQACIRWKAGEPYRACLMLVEKVALGAYTRVELRQSRGNRGLK